jgi:hypothetical protein
MISRMTLRENLTEHVHACQFTFSNSQHQSPSSMFCLCLVMDSHCVRQTTSFLCCPLIFMLGVFGFHFYALYGCYEEASIWRWSALVVHICSDIFLLFPVEMRYISLAHREANLHTSVKYIPAHRVSDYNGIPSSIRSYPARTNRKDSSCKACRRDKGRWSIISKGKHACKWAYL